MLSDNPLEDYSVIFIDDAFNEPIQRINSEYNLNIDNKKPLDINILDFMVKKANWGDEAVKNLVELLINEQKTNIQGFSNPNFFINSLSINKSDVIIFDWDFAATVGSESGTAELLLRILEQCYSQVYIFTGVDKLKSVGQLIAEIRFLPYSNRLHLYKKQGESSIEEIKRKLEDCKSTNFSSKFGKDIRYSISDAVERALVELGKFDIETALKLLEGENRIDGISNDIKEMISEKIAEDLSQDITLKSAIKEKFPEVENIDEFFDIIIGRIKNCICSCTLNVPEMQASGTSINKEIIEKLWAYRLYYHPNDSVVRKGDIIKKRGSTIDELFLVLSPDCNLTRFWRKNLGYLVLLKLKNISLKQGELKSLFEITLENGSKKHIGVTSLCTAISQLGGSALFFPCIIYENEFHSFIATPHEIIVELVTLPEAYNQLSPKKRAGKNLEYSHLIEYERVVTLSEPFLTQIVEIIFNEIKGYGVPDYPDGVKKEFNELIRGIFNDD